MTERRNVLHFGLRSLRLQAAANVASQDRGSDRPALEGPI